MDKNLDIAEYKIQRDLKDRDVSKSNIKSASSRLTLMQGRKAETTYDSQTHTITPIDKDGDVKDTVSKLLDAKDAIQCLNESEDSLTESQCRQITFLLDKNRKKKYYRFSKMTVLLLCLVFLIIGGICGCLVSKSMHSLSITK